MFIKCICRCWRKWSVLVDSSKALSVWEGCIATMKIGGWEIPSLRDCCLNSDLWLLSIHLFSGCITTTTFMPPQMMLGNKGISPKSQNMPYWHFSAVSTQPETSTPQMGKIHVIYDNKNPSLWEITPGTHIMTTIWWSFLVFKVRRTRSLFCAAAMLAPWKRPLGFWRWGGALSKHGWPSPLAEHEVQKP